jgi:SAM-dependent methyltransferase
MADASPYDAVLYPARAFVQTHPDRLATLATLFGLAPAPPAGCRVLELGCGAGGNLLPMAVGLPGSTFVGIDTSRRAIEHAQAVTERLGLRNIAFEEISIEDYEPDGGFDYVIAHGVYSWVPAHVRERLLALCASVLTPAGVAYVSYNALPGGHPRQALREMLAYHVGGIEQPAEQMAAARGFLRLLSAAGEADSELAKTLGPEARKLFEHVDALFFHDTLAENNQPLYFHEFVAQAGAHGLQFLSEAEFSEMQVGALPEQLQQALLTISDPLRREQYLDFLKERMFRQTLLVRSDIALDRTPRPERLAALAVSAPLRWATDEQTGRVTFTGAGGAHLTTDHPLVIGALQRVGDAWPSAPWIAQLGSEAELAAICDALLRCFAANLVRLHVHPPAVSTAAPEHPQVSPLARIEAAHDELLTTVRHTGIRLDDDLGRRLVTLLDGTRDRAALVAELAPGTAMERDELVAGLEHSLERLARAGLLLPDGA